MKQLNRNTNGTQHPIKVIQFGEGNFLRAFVDWMIDLLNEKADFNGSVAIVQPLPGGLVHLLNEQDGLYHHLRQGLENGQRTDDARLIRCISQSINPYEDMDAYLQLAETPSVELIFSNTTEAGIAFNADDQPKDHEIAATFPGKLTQLLFYRFKHFNGDPSKGLSIVPCELIEQNGTKLKHCVHQYIDLWSLGAAFKKWVDESCAFANTLVDRIVPGYPKEEIESIRKRIGYNDQLVVKSETFHLFVIQAPDQVKKAFPAHQYGLNVKYVDDITPFRTQKVRILNGAHTSMVPIGLLSGLETVSETIDHEETGKIVRDLIFKEIIPTIQIPGEDPKEFAEEVVARFQNPFIRHELMSISLNSISKFKVRVLPTFLDYLKLKGKLPARLTFALACLIALYRSEKFSLKDSQENLDFFQSMADLPEKEVAVRALSNVDFWGQDLTDIDGLMVQVAAHLKSIRSEQMNETILNI